jgi:hypothetical protein
MKKILLILLLIPLLSHAQCLTPTPPQTLTVTATSPYTVAVQTDHSQLPANGFTAQREPQGGTFVQNNAGYPSGFYVDNLMLLPNHTFCYRIRAYANCGTHSDWTQEVMVTMPDGPMPYQGAPEPPSELNATITNGGKVLLQWTLGAFPSVVGQPQYCQILRSLDAGITWQFLNTVSWNSCPDNNVVSGHTYSYKVRSFNGFGWATGPENTCNKSATNCGTAWSNITSITVP